MQNKTLSYKIITDKIPPTDMKYLKYWNHDYPYLNTVEKNNYSLLPVSVESDGQKHIINLYNLRRMS